MHKPNDPVSRRRTRLLVEDGRLTRLDLPEIVRQSNLHLAALIRRSRIDL